MSVKSVGFITSLHPFKMLTMKTTESVTALLQSQERKNEGARKNYLMTQI